jgi:hypothetical protein
MLEGSLSYPVTFYGDAARPTVFPTSSSRIMGAWIAACVNRRRLAFAMEISRLP